MLPLRAEIRTDARVLDERSAARRTLRLEVSTSSGGATKALIHNMSEKGLLLETAADLQVGEALQVELPHAGVTTALVIWGDGHFRGCEFTSPISKAAVSAALLVAPIEAPELGSAPAAAEAAAHSDVALQESAVGGTGAMVGLVIMLLVAIALVIALMSAPFSM